MRDACDAAGRFVALAIGVVLPLTIALNELLRIGNRDLPAMFLPPVAWRLDIVLIGVLLAALRMFAGRVFGRVEAAALFLIYAMYLSLTAILNAGR